ncbi:MAG: hypothetical protein ABW184_05960 [Sphingobium sp.]
MVDDDALPQPLPLLIAHARGPERDWHALCWRIDERMGRTVLGAKDAGIAALRLTWWEEALTDARPKASGEPTLEAWHGFAPPDRDKAWIGEIAGAWRMLLDPDPMSEADWGAFGRGRGALFPLIARSGEQETLRRAGALWSLWDEARRDGDRQRGEGALAAAIAVLEDGPLARVSSRPLSLAAAMAADDVRARTMPDPRFTPRQYLRLLRRALFA